MQEYAKTDSPVHDFIVKRWSPYAYSKRPVSKDDLRSLFEAARWAPSSYNEQPWRFIVAVNDDGAEFQRALKCLVEANQEWAQHAPVLVLGITHLEFNRNGKPNRAAMHDLGLASATLTFEATARGLYVHQMIGIEPEKVRQTYHVPDGYEPLTALTIGYRADDKSLPEPLKERDAQRRPRMSVPEFVFAGEWGDGVNFGRK